MNTIGPKLLIPFFCLPWLLFTGGSLAQIPRQHDAATAPIISFSEGDLQAVIDAAAPHTLILCDRTRPMVLSTPIVIRKPLHLKGLNAMLPDSLGKTALLEVRAKGVVLSDFELHGNASTVSQQERAPLLEIFEGDFTVERAHFTNSSKEGISIDAASKNLIGGVVRDVTGRNIMRDLVSINGGYEGATAGNILVENVRLYTSELRGAVEVSNGTDNITVRKVYAENCVYAVDVQDHLNPYQVNRNVLLEDIYAVNSKHAVRTANMDLGHSNLTIKDVIAENCTHPIQLSHTSNVLLQGVRVLNHPSGNALIDIEHCDGLILRDVFIRGSTHEGTALALKNCNHASVDGVMLMDAPKLKHVLHYELTNGQHFTGLQVSGVVAPEKEAGLRLSTSGDGGSLQHYSLEGNLTGVLDELKK